MIKNIQCKAWGLEQPQSPRFVGQIYSNNNNDDAKSDPGTIKVVTEKQCQDVCILSDLPIIAGLYDIKGKNGVYYEVSIEQMDGIIAVGKCQKTLSFPQLEMLILSIRHRLSTIPRVAPARLESYECRAPSR